MTETLVYSKILKEDLLAAPRNGTLEVRLADGSVVTGSAVDVAYYLSDAYTKATLTARSAVAGELARATDDVQGLWMRMPEGHDAPLNAGRINAWELGVKPDTTDVSTALNAAILRCYQLFGGGTVLLPPTGTSSYINCGTTAINLYPGVVLQGVGAGAGSGATRLRWGAASVALQTVDSSGVATQNSKSTTNAPWLRDLILDGNSAATDGVHWYTVSRGGMFNVEITGFTGDALEIAGGTTGTGAHYSNFYTLRCMSSGVGIKFTDGSVTKPNDNRFWGGQASANTTGIDTTGTTANDVKILGMAVENNTTGFNHAGTCQGWRVMHGHFESNTTSIVLGNNATDTVVLFNHIPGGETVTVGTGSGNIVQDTADPTRWVLGTGMQFRRASTGQTGFGLRIVGESVNRISVMGTGISFGDGSNAVDAQIVRTQADGIGLDSGDTMDLATNDNTLLEGVRSLTAAATLTLTSGNLFTVAGNTGITAISPATAGRTIRLKFSGTPTLTHNASAIHLAGASNYTASANDVLTLTCFDGSVWTEVGRAEN